MKQVTPVHIYRNGKLVRTWIYTMEELTEFVVLNKDKISEVQFHETTYGDVYVLVTLVP